MKVVIYGLRGVGVETAKNLTLQGVGSLTLVDANVIDIKDVGVNFFFHKEDVGQSRVSVMLPRLQELNPLCQLEVSGSLNEETLQGASALVITQPLPLPRLIELDELCRGRGTSFFYAQTSGVSADLFVDHGDNHVVFDLDGERPIQKLITDVQAVGEGEILVRYETPEGQQAMAINGGAFEVSEVDGIEDLNGRIFPATRGAKDPVKTVRLAYAMKEGERYSGGGLLTEKKSPTSYAMKSLKDKLKNPGTPFAEPPSLVSTDLLNFGAEHQQHVGMYAGLLYFTEKGHMPRPHNQEDYEAVLAIAKGLVEKGDVAIEYFDLNEGLIRKYLAFLGVELQPLGAFLGGVLAQEVVKCTGKFTPIPGFMHFSAFETLADDEALLYSAEDKAPRGHENDDLAAVFGWTLLEKVSNLRYFMVGCGALGCEFMKNFALNGIFCGPNGRLVVTDADRIELSNLTRQFLFREHNVGQPKSRAASAMAKIMNPAMKVEALELFVGAKTEDSFDDSFWLSLDGVCNALDNIEARLYVDRQCVKYEKSLLESGTMGTNGNVDTVCPFKTRTYAEGGNAAEGGGVPMCTLRNFPHLTDHCIEWARDQFELLFANLGKSLEAYRANKDVFEHKIADKAGSEPGAAFFDVRSLISFSRLAASPSIGNAAQTAFDIFHFLFRDRILDLQRAFPRDFRVIDDKTKEDKGPFWGEKKRYPTVAKFNPNDEAHLDFLLSTTCLLAVVVGLVPNKREDEDESWLREFRSKEWIQNIAQGLREPAYIPAPVNGAGLENVPPVDRQAVQNTLRGFFVELQASVPAEAKGKGEAVDFEKDDDANFHIAFVTACANLRCDNYSIKRTSFHDCKVIAGRIIPAIATTTAAVCGLVILELFKLAQNKGTDAYMNRAIGLGGFQYTSFTQEKPTAFNTKEVVTEPEPDEVPAEAFDERGKVKPEFLIKKVHRAYPENHSVWDKLSCSGDLTMQGFADWLLTEHNLKLQKWDFILGHGHKVDEETNKKVVVSISTPVYPPKPQLDYSLLPPLDLPLNQAVMQIMRNAKAKPSQQYQALWKELKAQGLTEVPPQPAAAAEQAITADTKLRDILTLMNTMAEEKLKKGEMESSTISHVDRRHFVLIESSDVPFCVDAKTNEHVEHLCSIKITLK